MAQSFYSYSFFGGHNWCVRLINYSRIEKMTTQTTFVTTMNALREFHKASCDHTPGARRQVLAKPVYPTVSALTSLTPEEAAAVEGLKEDSQRNGAVNTNEIQNQITADTERFKESGGGDAASEEFRKRMEEKRAAQKESSNKMIDDMFDKAIGIGEKYPATQGQSFLCRTRSWRFSASYTTRSISGSAILLNSLSNG